MKSKKTYIGEKETFQKEDAQLEKQRRAWIHCRVSKEPLRYLLNYQEKKARLFCESENMEVVGVTKEVGGGKSATEYYMSAIATEVRRNKIDCIVVYDKARLLIFEDIYMEFKIFCEMQGVDIISLEDL